MPPIEYRQLKAFATLDGSFVGLIWIASMACCVGQFRYNFLGLMALLLGLISIIFATNRAKRFGTEIREGKEFSFGQAWLYAMIMMICASLLAAIVAYIYFAFLDHGYMTEEYSKMLENPEMNKMLVGMSGDKNAGDVILEQMSAMRPIEWAFNVLSTNVIIGIVLSLVIAVFARKKSTL